MVYFLTIVLLCFHGDLLCLGGTVNSSVVHQKEKRIFFARRYQEAERELRLNVSLLGQFEYVMGWRVGKGKQPIDFMQAADALCKILGQEKSFSTAFSLVCEARKEEKRKRLIKWAGASAAVLAAGGAVALARSVANKKEGVCDGGAVGEQFGKRGTAKPVVFVGDVGNKAINSGKLITIAKDLGTKHGYTFEVPHFFAISSDAVKRFFRNKLGVDVDAAWAENVTESSSESLKGAHRVRELINQKMSSYIDSRGQDTWEDLFGEEGKAFAVFLDKYKPRTSFMVRSTGNEDTETLANAGGNETAMVIAPHPDIFFSAMLRAMQRVLLSYIGSKSLSQRLDAKDNITLAPLMPLLVQLRIAEEDEAHLPRCGVMYTEDPASSVYLSEKRSSGLTLVQSAFGDNELVVNSHGSVDTFIVGESDDIYPIVRIKPHRLRANVDGVFEQIGNNSDVKNSPSLDREMLLALKECARCLEKFFSGVPQDVEFIVMPERKIIYLLQTRPLVMCVPRSYPNYIDTCCYDAKKALEAEVVGIGGGFVRLIKSQREIVFSQTLFGAYNNVYADLTETEKAEVSLFVVKEVAAATSHEANSVARLGLPVFCLKELYDSFKEKVQNCSDFF